MFACHKSLSDAEELYSRFSSPSTYSHFISIVFDFILLVSFKTHYCFISFQISHSIVFRLKSYRLYTLIFTHCHSFILIHFTIIFPSSSVSAHSILKCYCSECITNKVSTSRVTAQVFKYITGQIWLPHCKFKSHSHDAKRAYGSYIFAYICQNTTNSNSYFTLSLNILQKHIYPPNWEHMLYMPNTDVLI